MILLYLCMVCDSMMHTFYNVITWCITVIFFCWLKFHSQFTWWNLCIFYVYFLKFGYSSKWIHHFISTILSWSSLSPSIRASAFKLTESESFDFNPLRPFQCPFLPYQMELDYLRSSKYCVLSRPASISCVFPEKPPTLAQAQPPSDSPLQVLKAEDTMNQQEVPPPLGQLRHSGRQEGHPERTYWKGHLPRSRRLQQDARPRRERAHCCRAPGTHHGQAVRLSPHLPPSPPGGLGPPQRALVSDSPPACLPSSSLITDVTCALWSEAFPPHSWPLSPLPPKVSLHPSTCLKTSISISASASRRTWIVTCTTLLFLLSVKKTHPPPIKMNQPLH